METDPILSKKTLGPYSVSKKLGEGGMGAVYLGYHRVLQVQHALKVVHPRMTSDTQLIERFNREARNAARLVHPNIVQVITADVVGGVYYIAMQYVEGFTLATIAKRQGVEVHQAVRWIHMVAKALDYAHSKNIIHRDIKPGNIMIDKDDNAKLMDFGLVRELEPAADAAEAQPLTGAGLMVGTPQYMPPEQWNGEVDHRSDLFALGVTFYNVLSGEHPFGGRTMAEIFRNVVQGKSTSIRVHMPELDPGVAAIIEKATKGEPAARYQSGREFAAALEKWWNAHPPTESGTQLDPSSVQPVDAGNLGTPSKAFKSTTRVSAVKRSRAGSVDTPTNQREAPTIPSAATPPPARLPKGLLAAGGIGLGLAIAGGAFFFFGGGNGTGVGPAAGITIQLPSDQATESRPLRTAQKTFSIPGEAGGATVLLNGKPYSFGSAVSLVAGLNRLEVATGAGDGKNVVRVLFVHQDADPPVLEVPAITGAKSGEIRIEAQSFALEGTVRDDDAEVKVELKVEGQPPRAVPVSGGKFSDLVKVEDRPVSIEITAVDRAGNAASPLRAVLIPDRETLTLTWIDEVAWFGSRKVVLKGKSGKTTGVTLQAGGNAIPLGSDGTFSLGLEFEPGRHAVEIEAKDALGRMAKLAREVTVDLEAPVFREVRPESGSAVSVESLPATIEITGKLDGPEAQLTVGGDSVKVEADGSFLCSVRATAHGDLEAALAAKDPADRVTRLAWKAVVKPLRYRRGEKNAQGCVEYVRRVDRMVMVAIPGGEFKLGVAEGLPDARARAVKLTPYLIGKHEVSVEQFAKFLEAEGLKPEDVASRQWLMKDALHLEYAGGWTVTAGSERLPVVGVTWSGARAYAKWADPDAGDLPSEAQWEFAARGTEGRLFPWGNDAPNANRCNFDGAGFDEAQGVDVCAGGVSLFGVLNLSGNVEEWCLDWYDIAGYSRLAAENPVTEAKPAGADRRVVRGGSYLSPYRSKPDVGKADGPCDLSAAFRGRRVPASGAVDRGFRCVASPLPE